jgi:hypothetical protein
MNATQVSKKTHFKSSGTELCMHFEIVNNSSALLQRYDTNCKIPKAERDLRFKLSAILLRQTVLNEISTYPATQRFTAVVTTARHRAALNPVGHRALPPHNALNITASYACTSSKCSIFFTFFQPKF